MLLFLDLFPDLFAPPQMLKFYTFWGADESIGGPGPTRGTGNSNTDARPTVTFPAARHHRPLAGTKLYCLVTEARVC